VSKHAGLRLLVTVHYDEAAGRSRVNCQASTLCGGWNLSKEQPRLQSLEPQSPRPTPQANPGMLILPLILAC
jgi:hypothetical protein